MICNVQELEAKNYYQILEIEPNASQVEIENAYRRSLNAYSDDSVAIYSLLTTDDCENIRREIEQAYTILSSPEKRRDYNQTRGIQVIEQTMESFVKPVIQESKKALPTQNKPVYQYNIDFDFEQRIENTENFSGIFLKEIREYKNISLEEISQYTRILKTYLVYIEEEDFEKLPATAYVRGFVVQYAKYLKLNPDFVSSSYTKSLKNFRNELD